MQTTYILGHTNPDTDSIATAMALAKFIPNSEPARIGEINPETEFLLKKLNLNSPQLFTELVGKNLYLIDHSERSQSLPSIEKANVLAIIDHHKIGFTTSSPIIYLARPVGCTSTIIADLYFSKAMHIIDGSNEIELDTTTATLMIAAIISDTLLLKSPTTTDFDKIAIEKLMPHAKVIDNYEEFGMELLRSRSNFINMSPEQIFDSGAKNFKMNGKNLCISQLEVVDPKSLDPYIDQLFEFSKNKLHNENFDLILFIVTDILNSESCVYAFGEVNHFEAAFNCKTSANKVNIPNLISRKKQIVPVLENYFMKK